jgi:DNA-binding MurR/RpiR family transcriptional regulator
MTNGEQAERAPTVIERLRRIVQDLTPSEQQVVETLMADYPLVAIGSLARFAEVAKVSGPTVLRLINKLGYSGYPQFREQLRLELSTRLSPPSDQPVVEGAGQESILPRAYRSFVESARGTWSGLNPADVEYALDLLADPARSVVIAGGTFSAIIAAHMARYLTLLRPNVLEVPSGRRPHAAALLDVDPRTTAVIFDYRDYQPETIAFAVKCRRSKAKVVLVCDRFLSPIASTADVVLPTSVEGPPPFDSVIGGFMIADTLVSGVAERLGLQSRERIEDYLQNVHDMSSPLTRADDAVEA